MILSNTYTILEDASPYYVRFTWKGLSDIIEYVNKQPLYLKNNRTRGGYAHWDYDRSTADGILDMMPLSAVFNLNRDRVSLFVTPPGGSCSIHKDGPYPDRCGINITLGVFDDKCITSWYPDEIFTDTDVKKNFYTRSIQTTEKYTPIKTTVFKSHECVLFNTDIYHTWDNTESTNQRIVLTFRFEPDERVNFHEAKNILFNT